MRKAIRMVLAMVFMMTLFMSGTAFSASYPDFIVVVKDNDYVNFTDAKPEVIEGRTFVPVRTLSELMGMEVEWNATENKVVLRKDGKWCDIYLGSDKLKFSNGDEVTAKVYVKNQRTMAQFRAIAEHFDYEVSYIANGPIARFVSNSNETVESEEELYNRIKTTIDAERKLYLEEKKAKEEEARKAEEAKYPTVYLTFDDGPNANTPRILDILKKYDMKATFFLLDGNMKRYPEYTRRIISEGHSVGLHSISHDKNKLYLTGSAYSVLNEMSAQNNNLKNLFGVSTDLVRVPYGSKPLMTSSQFWTLRSAGYRVWDWHIDSLDYKSSSSQIYRNVVPNIAPKVWQGIAPVVLFHDKSQTADALPGILDYLKKSGYKSRAIGPSAWNYNWWER